MSLQQKARQSYSINLEATNFKHLERHEANVHEQFVSCISLSFVNSSLYPNPTNKNGRMFIPICFS